MSVFAGALLAADGNCAEPDASFCKIIQAVDCNGDGGCLWRKIKYLVKLAVSQRAQSGEEGGNRLACSCGSGSIEPCPSHHSAIGRADKLVLSLSYLAIGEGGRLHRGESLGYSLDLRLAVYPDGYFTLIKEPLKIGEGDSFLLFLAVPVTRVDVYAPKKN